MKTILLIGDSWGVPNYEGPNCGAHPHEHTEYILRNLGYKVYNCSLNGVGNLKSLNLAKSYLSGEFVTIEPVSTTEIYCKNNKPGVIDDVNPKIDFIVWFHTEGFRDFFQIKKSIEYNLTYIYEQTYKEIANFVKSLNSKLIVIGGQAPVLTNLLYSYITPYYIIEDWRSELLQKKLPAVYSLANLDWIKNSGDSIEYKNDLLEKHKEVLDAMVYSDLFPDNCHPGKEAHASLSATLDKLFTNE